MDNIAIWHTNLIECLNYEKEGVVVYRNYTTGSIVSIFKKMFSESELKFIKSLMVTLNSDNYLMAKAIVESRQKIFVNE